MEDPHHKLVNAQKGKTKAMRQWRIQSEEEIDEQQIAAYVKEAIENQKAGREIKPQRTSRLRLPPELKSVFAADTGLHHAFRQLTPGQRREYAVYIAEAKRADTKQRRLEKKESDLTSGSPVAENDATDGRPDENDTSPAANEPNQ